MTNNEKLNAMPIAEKAKFLSNISKDDSIVNKWFTANCCSKCDVVEIMWGGKIEKWKECDFDGKCKIAHTFEDIVALWLASEEWE